MQCTTLHCPALLVTAVQCSAMHCIAGYCSWSQWETMGFIPGPAGSGAVPSPEYSRVLQKLHLPSCKLHQQFICPGTAGRNLANMQTKVQTYPGMHLKFTYS